MITYQQLQSGEFTPQEYCRDIALSLKIEPICDRYLKEISSHYARNPDLSTVPTILWDLIIGYYESNQIKIDREIQKRGGIPSFNEEIEVMKQFAINQIHDHTTTIHER